MPTEPDSGGGNISPGIVLPSRAPYVLPLFVLVAMLFITLIAGVFRLRTNPIFDESIQSLPTLVFLAICVGVSLSVFLVLLRFVRVREGLVRTLLTYQEELRLKQAKLAERNDRLSLSTEVQSREISERFKDLERSRTAMVSLLEDLTESRDNIDEARAFNAAVLASIADGVMVLDTNGEVTLVNDAFVRLYGLPGGSESLLRKNALEYFTLLDSNDNPVPRDVGPAARVLRDGAAAKPQRESAYRLRRSDGLVLDIEYEASPVVRSGALVAVVVLVRDVSEQRRIDRAKSEFVSLASHQLRTPLTAIGWYAEMLLDETAQKLSLQEKEYLDEVYRANRRMIELVDALLNVSRIEMGAISVQPEIIDLRGFIRDLVAIFAPIISAKQLTVTSEFAPGINTYTADRKIMEIIMQNLLSNAIKYTPEKGSVILRVVEEDAQVVLSVADSGIGIPKPVQVHVFQKLFRADNAQLTETDGSGLGLYLVKSIVEQVGGEISFTSEIGKGTTFVVRLPSGGMKARVGVQVLMSSPPSAGAVGVVVPASKS